MKSIRIEITTRAYVFLCCLCCAALLFMGVPIGASADTESANSTSSADVEQMPSEEFSDSADSSSAGVSDDTVAASNASKAQEEAVTAASTESSSAAPAAASATAPVASSPSADSLSIADEVKNTPAEEAIEPASEEVLLPQSVSGSVGTLSVQLSNESSVYVDVDTFPNHAVDWETSTLRTMHIDLEFGSGSGKNVVINVPTGYQIVGYSATESTAAIDGVQKITIDNAYADTVSSSVLKATDGVSSWAEQKISGYTKAREYWESDTRTYGGIITYGFTDAANKAELMVTLKPQDQILTHLHETETLDDITVAMNSNHGSLSSSFHANVVDIMPGYVTYDPTTPGAAGGNVPVNEETGLSEEFGIGASYCCWSTMRGYTSFLMDKLVCTITYPKGVYYNSKVFCDALGLGFGNNFGPGTYANGHVVLEVTGNVNTGGTVTCTLNDSTFFDMGSTNTLASYFVADTNSGFVSPGDTLQFQMDLSRTNHGVTVAQETKPYWRTLVAGSGGYDIDMTDFDVDRYDLHADYPGLSGDIALGGFWMGVNLPYSNVPLDFDFSQLRGVRSMYLPGYNIHDIVATTTEGRMVTVNSLPGSASSNLGVPLSAETLGLHENEYLVHLNCKADLSQQQYGTDHAYAFSYYGKFADHQTGEVHFSILNADGTVAQNIDGDTLTEKSRQHFALYNTCASWTDTKVSDSKLGDSVTTFFPNDTLYFRGDLGGGCDWTTVSTLIDPIVMISLPKGINLDTNSVTIWSQALQTPNGSGEEEVQLVQVKSPMKTTVDGIEWTTYYFTSANPMDVLALEAAPSNGTNSTPVEVYFQAHVASNAPEYGQLSLADVLQWDTHQTAVTWRPEYVSQDLYNRAGHGTDYYLFSKAGRFNTKRLIGLNVDLGIRAKNSGTDFFTYDSTEDSIAPITPATLNDTEVRIGYENVGSSDFQSGSVIFLPIPKKGWDYAKYFQNIELNDPATINNSKPFEFTLHLKSQVNVANLPGFKVEYAVDPTLNPTDYDPAVNPGTWAPVNATWLSYEDLINHYELSDVLMIRLTATSTIGAGNIGFAIFDLSLDDECANGQVDYWRAYSKAVTNQQDNSGIWRHSSVVAATPASTSLQGQIFLDNDFDGFFDVAAGDAAYTDGNVSAILSRDDGGMNNLALAVESDGSFRALNSSNGSFYFKAGNYTITFTNTDTAALYSKVAGAQASSADAWYNNIQPADISEQTATYHFTVDENTTANQYVGVGLGNEYISIDVPVKVKLAVNTDGSWCAPTARDNRIINHSNVAITTTDITSTATPGFTLLGDPDDQATPNGFSGTVCANNGLPVLLGQTQTPPASQWTMSADNGSDSDRSDELALQLNGRIQNVSDHYFTAPIHLFDSTYTFEKAL